MSPKPIARIYYSDETDQGRVTYGHDVYTEDKIALLVADYRTAFTDVHVCRYQKANLESLAFLLRDCAAEVITVAPDDHRVVLSFWADEYRPSKIEITVQEKGERPFLISLRYLQGRTWTGSQVATAATVDGAAAVVLAVRQEEVQRLNALEYPAR